MKDNKRMVTIGLVLLMLAVTVGFLVNIDGHLEHDDEGTDFYEAWRLAEGEQPGIDFMAEQQPLFLLAGGALIKAFGNVALPLRVLSAVQVLVGLGILLYAVGRIFGWQTGALAILLVTTSGMVYRASRLYRPDPMMLAWMMAGMACALLAAAERKRWLWWISGAAYGVAFMWKPFALLPVFGIALFFGHELLRNVDHRREVVSDGLRFALAFVLFSVVINGALHLGYDLYYLDNLGQHAALGRDINPLFHLLRPLTAYVEFFLGNPVFLFVLPLWWLNRPGGRKQRAELRLLLWQLAAPVLFIALTRPFYPTYMMFLVPVFAILLAWQLSLMLERVGVSRFGALAGVALIVLLLLFALQYTNPRIRGRVLWHEEGTMALAEYVANNSKPGELVLSDYAGINFFANRKSIYEASIIAGGRIRGGFITGDLLIERMEQDDVKLVLIHVAGGNPHQLVRLSDYDRFRAYLDKNYELLTLFERNGQQIEVFSQSS